MGGTDGLPGLEAAGVRMGGNEFFQMILMRYDYLQPILEPTKWNISVLTHEVGHFFFLRHTFKCYYNEGTGEYDCENVTRDVTDTECYNAHEEGDKIIDTNATPVGMQYNDDPCEYISNGELDSCNTPYDAEGLEPEIYNFMSYTGKCKSEFTPGQGTWMRWFILQIINEPNVFAIETYPVSILYEPYDGEYYVIGPTTSHNPRFQKGFDYEFIDCSCNDEYNCDLPIENVTGNEYSSTNQVIASFNVDETPDNHPNHTAIRILQINQTWSNKCYDNWNRRAIGGLVTKFNDNVFNTNVTQTVKDSTSINDQNLIQNLDTGLYNVKKQFNDGTIEESNIFKNNQ